MAHEPKRRWVVTGSGGQLGRCLAARLEQHADHELLAAFDHAALDVADPDALRRAFAGLPGGPPDVVANAAAMTHVDHCEAEPDRAQAANADAPAYLAALCREAGCQLVHVSTDYVFDGNGTRPYRETDPTAPRSVYGRTKLAGEQGVLETLPEAIVVRTAWVFGPGRNFVRTILEAAARARSEPGAAPLRVVDDQRGSPTYADDLAAGLVALVEAGAQGIVHLANAGTATWWELARAAVDAAGHPELPIEKVTTEAFPRPAPRPAWSVLDTARAAEFGVRLRPWRDALHAYLESDVSPLRDQGEST